MTLGGKLKEEIMEKKFYVPVPPHVERVGKAVLDAAFKVHTALDLVSWNQYMRLVQRLRPERVD